MAKLPGSFNSSKQKGMDDLEALPRDRYTLEVQTTDYAQNKKKNGHILKVKMKVLGGKYNGRIIFRNLNLDNPSATAVEMANKELTSIAQACGVVVTDESSVIHGIPFEADLTIKTGSGDYPDSNDVKKYYQKKGIAKPQKPGSDSSSEKPKSKLKRPIFEDDEPEEKVEIGEESSVGADDEGNTPIEEESETEQGGEEEIEE